MEYLWNILSNICRVFLEYLSNILCQKKIELCRIVLYYNKLVSQTANAHCFRSHRNMQGGRRTRLTKRRKGSYRYGMRDAANANHNGKRRRRRQTKKREGEGGRKSYASGIDQEYLWTSKSDISRPLFRVSSRDANSSKVSPCPRIFFRIHHGPDDRKRFRKALMIIKWLIKTNAAGSSR